MQYRILISENAKSHSRQNDIIALPSCLNFYYKTPFALWNFEVRRGELNAWSTGIASKQASNNRANSLIFCCILGDFSKISVF